jgi:metal-responsive CopG/Arc/MetJ family transcriptional regulator
MRGKTLSTRVPDAWLGEIDELVARKYPGRTRSDWLFAAVETALAREQQEGADVGGQLTQLLANDVKVITKLDEIYALVQNR